jgi:hypothetical protein
MKHKTMFRLGLKLIGIWLILTGLASLISALTGLMLYFMPNLGLTMGAWQLYVAQFLIPLLQIGVGPYLFFDGRWIADKAIPGNRPYCHECGYDLTGAAGNTCTECGTAFKAP